MDQIYDELLANGVRPFIELSFMLGKLASRQAVHSFKYHPIVAPPRNYAKWDALIAAFAAHLIDRYGIDEVAQWYFEVWNEPNLDFWAGQPKQSSYWTLYDHGSPTYPTPAQLEQLLKASALAAPQEVPIVDGRLSITLPAHALATIELVRGQP